MIRLLSQVLSSRPSNSDEANPKRCLAPEHHAIIALFVRPCASSVTSGRQSRTSLKNLRYRKGVDWSFLVRTNNRSKHSWFRSRSAAPLLTTHPICESGKRFRRAHRTGRLSIVSPTAESRMIKMRRGMRDYGVLLRRSTWCNCCTEEFHSGGFHGAVCEVRCIWNCSKYRAYDHHSRFRGLLCRCNRGSKGQRHH